MAKTGLKGSPEKVAKDYPRTDWTSQPAPKDSPRKAEDISVTKNTSQAARNAIVEDKSLPLPPFPDGKLPEDSIKAIKEYEDKKVKGTITSDEQSEHERLYNDKRSIEAWQERKKIAQAGGQKTSDLQGLDEEAEKAHKSPNHRQKA